MKMTCARYFGKSREQIKEEIIKKSIADMDLKLSGSDMKRFMSLDKNEQKRFVTMVIGGPSRGK
jgi:hypothetical protein